MVNTYSMEKRKKNQMKYWKNFFIFVLFLCSVKFVSATNYTDNDGTESGFGGGTHTNTQWDAGNNWLEMDTTGMTNGFATYTSRIINGGFSDTWSTFSWTPQRPLMKELPDDDGVETAYSAGNMDMTSTTLLYHFNESSGDISDTSGSSLIGTLTGATHGVAGRFNKAISFDGTGDYINVGDSLESSFSGSFTMSTWVYPTDTTNESILSKYSPTSGKRQWVFNILNGKPSITMYGNLAGTSYRQYKIDSTISANQWYHLVFIGNNVTNEYHIYINGYEVSGTETVSGAFVSVQDSNESTLVGGSQLGAAAYGFNGVIDELAVFGGRMLSASDVLSVYKRGALRARYQIRSCNDAACAGESFVGPAGVTNDYFEEQDTNTISLPTRTISSIVSDNQYFQYRLALETVSSTLSAEINSVTVAGPTPGSFTVSSISGNTTEAGGTATYTVVLDRAPTANVTIEVSSSNTNEGTVSPPTLTFTSANWNTPQTVTVTGVSDLIVDGDIAYTIVNSASVSSDVSYNAIDPDDVSVINTDSGAGAAAVPEFSDFFGLLVIGIGGIFIFSRVKKFQLVKSG